MLSSLRCIFVSFAKFLSRTGQGMNKPSDIPDSRLSVQGLPENLNNNNHLCSDDYVPGILSKHLHVNSISVKVGTANILFYRSGN